MHVNIFKAKKLSIKCCLSSVKIELFCPFRCTSVLSDDSELSTPCDGEALRRDEVKYVCKNLEVKPDLLSSSEDSSPEADLPFSKKFLNVFVNSTSRSSSKLHTEPSSAVVYDIVYDVVYIL